MITNKDLHLFYTCSFLGRGRGACSLRQEWSKGDWDKMVISPWTYKRITKSRYFSLWRSERKPKKWEESKEVLYQFQFSSVQFSSVQFIRSVVSNSLWPHELQHVRPPCPSPTPGVHPNSCPPSRWCHPPTIIPFSSCPQPAQHQSLFQWVNSSHEVAKVLEFQL